MPEIEYEVPLGELGEGDDSLRLRLTTDRGAVVAFTVQQETLVDGERKPIARYDTAHGRPHRDLLDRRGRVVDKRWLPEDLSLKDALEWGRRDLLANWPRYRAAFLEGTT